MMSQGTRCTVTVVPIKGKPALYDDVAVNAARPTIGDALKQTGVDVGKGFVVMQNGSPASASDRLQDGANISLTERAAGS
jgi:sulfur carrier protein ThiS